MIDREAVRNWIFENISHKRAAHIFGCVEMARILARRFGGDEEKAVDAALLHDLTKERSYEEQLNLCRKYGIIPDETVLQTPSLFHALTGAGVAGDLWDAPEDVCHAIRVHTTGCVGMSKLDKILCLADYIEPGRHFKKVETLRELAETSLDEALCKAFDGTIILIVKEGGILHPQMVQARNDLLRTLSRS